MVNQIVEYEHFFGEHCETNATGNLLKQQGIELTEPMLFGLGSGLSFIYLNLKTLPLPFIGGRIKPFVITQNLCQLFNWQLQMNETTSAKKALTQLEQGLKGKKCVGLQLDSYYLPYFNAKIHFAGHFLAVYGIQESTCLIIDTQQQGGLQTSPLDLVEKARMAKGPMSAKARSWTIAINESLPPLEPLIKKAIKLNCEDYLNPSFKGMSFEGIIKLAKSLPKWIKLAEDPAANLKLASILMERGGTGGSIFRNFYRDFLNESFAITKDPILKEAADDFANIADNWHEVAHLIATAGEQLSVTPLEQASKLCSHLAEQEQKTLTGLYTKITL